MTKIEFEDGAVSIDATVIAAGLGIDPALVHWHMRNGRITSLCERGTDEDAGRHRLTFRFRGRSFRVTADDTGQIIAQETVGHRPGRAP